MPARSCQIAVGIQEADFDIAALQRSLLRGQSVEGAVATFTGYVRSDSAPAGMALEHYPGMTEKSIEHIARQAAERWPVLGIRVVHRVGRLYPGDQIVWVGVSAAHRDAAHSACEFVMDYLKADAPLWKKEFSAGGENWVEAKASDSGRATRWLSKHPQ